MLVTPVETGVQENFSCFKYWIPAFAGMTARLVLSLITTMYLLRNYRTVKSD